MTKNISWVVVLNRKDELIFATFERFKHIDVTASYKLFFN